MLMQDEIAELLQEHNAAALLISQLPKVRQLCGFTGSRALLVLRPDQRVLLTDRRYQVQAAREVRYAAVVTENGSFTDIVRRHELLEGADGVLFEGDHLTVSVLAAWKQALPDYRWIAGTNLLGPALARKDQDAFKAMRRAQRIADEAFKQALRQMRPGMRERELAAAIACALLRHGAERLSFDPIVASGPNSALPHARPTDRRLKHGEVVLLDFGCVWRGYASDMTRVVALGEPSDRVRNVHEVVHRAQSQAMDAVQAGIAARTLDAVARSAIANAGLGEYFVHGLGHGVGLQVHEWPRISKISNDIVPAGVTITLEPGVYLPDAFGVRIEDTVMVTDHGCERLGTTQRKLFRVNWRETS